MSSLVGSASLVYSSRLFTGGSLSSSQLGSGYGWLSPALPYLSQTTPDEVAVMLDECDVYRFIDHHDGTYTLKGPTNTLSLVLDTSSCRFRFHDCNGDVWYFTRTGDFESHVPNRGSAISVAGRDSSGRVTGITRTTMVGGAPVYDTNRYTYIAAGENAGLIESVTYERTASPTEEIRRMVFTYYGSLEAHGSLGDLKTVTEQIAVDGQWFDKDTSYYRYYKAGQSGGFEHAIKFALEAGAFARLKADPAVADPLLASDSQVAQYADFYYEYNADRRVTKSVTRGGLLTYLFSYQSGSSSTVLSDWTLATTTTFQDGTIEKVYSNYLGQPLLRDFADGSNHWFEYYEYNANGQETLHALPSAVQSYNPSVADLAVVLKAAAGLIYLNEYAASTTATATVAGSVEDHLTRRSLQQGTTGTPILLREEQYLALTADGHTIYPVGESMVSRWANDPSGDVTTSTALEVYAGTTKIRKRTTTLPIVPLAQHGDEAIDQVTEIYDEEGKLVWEKDARGFVSYRAYDPVTKALVQQIQDVDDAQLALPDSWTTPSGGGLHLVTDFEHDVLGRTLQTLGPAHDVEGQTVRTASWTVYQDLDDELWLAQGYAVPSGSTYTYTLVNPVSIQRSALGVQDAIVAVRDPQLVETCECEAPEAGNVASAGRLSASDSFPQSSWVRWSQSSTDRHGRLSFSRTYHLIPEGGTGIVGSNFDETNYGYDLMARQNKVLSPSGTISRSVYDAQGRLVASYLGTSDTGATDSDPTGGGALLNNMKLVAAQEYDQGLAGGDGNLTQQTSYVDGNSANNRVTTFLYDFRNRRIATDGEEDFYEEYWVDNLDRVWQTDRRDTTALGNLVSRSFTSYDDRGRVITNARHRVDPATGTVSSTYLFDDYWFDAADHVICHIPIGGKLCTKTRYDGVGRAIASYTGYSPALLSTDVDPLTLDFPIYEQAETTYDAASHVLLATQRQRFHDATGQGPLQGPAGTQPKSRDSYQAFWHDGLGRGAAKANYGTNDNAGTPTRPSTPPQSSDSLLVWQTRYNERGEAFESIDPAGIVMHIDFDQAGRSIRTIQNFLPDENRCYAAGSDRNIVVERVYGLGGRLEALVAKNPETGEQVTSYEYGTTLAASGVASNDLPVAEIYPDSQDAQDRVAYTYNRQGERTSLTDQNGSFHEYTYDKLGRQTQDRVTTLASGVDGAVRRIEQSYEVRGMVERITSYDAASGGSVVNDVLNQFNDYGQLTAQYQSHSGAVNTVSTPKVQYDYADGEDVVNSIRPQSLTYPNGRVLEYLYDDTAADKLSRVRTLRWDGTDVCRYSYLGIGNFVQTDYLEPEIRLNYASGSGSNPYAGFDRFGRVVGHWWQRTNSATDDVVHLKYGYDRAGNRTYREDLVAQSYGKDFDELYEYDRLNRLKDFHRGRLTADNAAITGPDLQQRWQLDATGNWQEFAQSQSADASQTLAQRRQANTVNEITDIATVVGDAWATPEYDRNGNMTVIPQPKDMTETSKGTWDAWNRLVKLEEPNGSSGWQTLAEYQYDGQAWRTVAKSYASGVLSETRHFYFTRQWQDIEERLGTTPNSASANRQFVWGERYIDDLVLRDRDTDGSGSLDERLYAMQDANWNVTVIADVIGDVRERNAYSAYGEAAVLTPSLTSRVSSSYEWEIRQSGYRWDGETNIYQVRHRYLHAGLGLWTSQDPIAYASGLANLYAYSHYSPFDMVDPYGLDPLSGTLRNCYNNSINREFAVPRWIMKALALAGLPDIEVEGKFTAQFQMCSRLCDTCNHWAPSRTGTISAELNAKGVSWSKDLAYVRVELGAYFRAGVVGSLQFGYEGCTDTYTGGGCISTYAEGGLLGSVEVKGSDWVSFGGGARGGIRFTSNFCLRCRQGERCDLTVQVCIDFRWRIWGFVRFNTWFSRRKWEYVYEDVYQACTDQKPFLTL
jgi:RHS repeat-associated protein